MRQCTTSSTLLLLLAAAALLSSASREADEECISAITGSLIDLEDSPKEQLRQAFQVIARSQLYGRPLQIQEHLEKRVYDILSAADQCGAGTPAVPCLLDPTLPTPPKNKKIFIASNLHNNAALMPHYITQLLLSVVSLTPGDTFVSLYESGSTDGTGAWLQLMDALLALLEVPKQIVTGGRVRPEDMDRIEFLAKIRNLASAPMQQMPDLSAPAWPADRLVFLNDVFFCAGDLIRLLQHEKADVACGMDFVPWKSPPSTNDIQPYGPYGPPLSVAHDPQQLQFYDFWVARDVDGLPLSNVKPFVHHGYSLQRLERGLPFPVACCWNGMVSMNAEPFTHHSLRFRKAGMGECRECEAALLCRDFLNLGYSKLLVDPGVRLAYSADAARQRYTKKVDIPLAPWANVSVAGPVDFDFAPRKFRMTCCSKDAESDNVDFSQCAPEAVVYEREMQPIYGEV